MPPSTNPIFANLGRRSAAGASSSSVSFKKRQSEPPTCATTCLLAAPTTDCPSGFTDGACLCSSSTFLSEAESCWSETCSGSELADAYSYGAYFCEQYGIAISTSSAGSSASATSSISSAAASASASTTISASPVASTSVTENAAASAAATLTALSTPTAPVTTPIDPMFKIDTIMGSICAFIFACALIVGFSACRGRYKREKQESEIRSRSQWTTQAGSNGDGGVRAPDESRKNGYGFISRNGAAGQTSTIQIAHATRSHHQMTHLDTTGFIGMDELDPIQSVDEHGHVGIASTLGAGASTIDFDDISPSSDRFLIDGDGTSRGKGKVSDASAGSSNESIPLQTLSKDGKKGGAVPDNWGMDK